MKKKVIPIGTTVLIRKMVDNQIDYQRGLKPLEVIRLDPPVVGKIVGGTYMMTGVYHASSYYPFSNNDDIPAYVVVDEMVFVYLVRLGFTNKPIKVLPGDVELGPYLFELPYRVSKKVKWSDKDREYLRDIMKSVPRDSKGRWLK